MRAAPPVASLPAAATTVALYLRQLADAGAAISTLRRRVAAISVAHQLAGHVEQANPARTVEVRTMVAGIARRQAREDGHPAKATALRTAGCSS